MTNPTPGTPEWHALVKEDIIDPDRAIVDTHHHLWQRENGIYLLEDLWQDTGSGHNIVKTVFVQCGSAYREEAPEHLRCVGETEFVTAIARESEKGSRNQPRIAGIVSYADLTLGNQVNEILDAHEEAGGNLFKGIRHAGAHAHTDDAEFLTYKGADPPDLFLREDFRQGVRLLGKRGLTYETWHFHYQNQAFAELARAVPDTNMILDHFGTPLGVGPYADKREEIYQQWKKDIANIAQCKNVIAKLGGLAMPDNGFGWDLRATPPTSDEFAAAQKRYYLHTIDCFGPERCMFESNFPVDRRSLSYQVLLNGFKKIVAGFSEDEKNAMCSGTATRVYRL